MRHKIYILMACLLASAGLWSCTDDTAYADIGAPGEGESTVQATVAFTPFVQALDARSAGDALAAISSLSVAIFDTDGNLIQGGLRDITDFRSGSAAGNATESAVATASFSLGKIPFGQYKIYAIANIPDFSRIHSSLSTESELLDLPLRWDSRSASANSQMLGWFEDADNTAGSDAREARPVAINRPAMKLRAELRRAASKLTVAFDATSLHDNVKIYIKSIQVKDIPAEANLGAVSKASSGSDLISDGETIFFPGASAGQDYLSYKSWTTVIQNGDPVHGLASPDASLSNAEKIAVHHGENVPALYFYENMQGTGPVKWQDKTGANSSVTYPGSVNPGHEYFKDKMPYGTYVEIQAYYSSFDRQQVEEGPIVYRFMLGKDINADYNAERNHHYRLTLAFNGWANDVDWHIDYKKTSTGITVPEKYYVSYLYNRDAYMPVSIIPRDGYKPVSVKGLIIENGWNAHDYKAGDIAVNTKAIEWQNTKYPGNYADGNLKGARKDTHYGFLSLRKTKDAVFGSHDLKRDNAEKELLDYYTNHNRGWRTYAVPANDTGSDGKTYTDGIDGDYTVIKEGNNYIYNMPLYTRAKSMVPLSAYTGNNPFASYQRKAVVRYEVTFQSETNPGDRYTLRKDVPVYQVRRVLNPKAIWRKSGDYSPFDVNLTVTDSEKGTAYRGLTSEGPWRAVIEKDPDGLIQLSAGGKSVTGEGKEITGGGGSEIKFRYTPRRPSDSNSTKPRCGIIRVEYHNYSCYHIILVRQGYDPIAVVSGGAKWSSYNLYSATALTNSPLSIGSFFRRGRNEAIREYNSSVTGLKVGDNPGTRKFSVLAADNSPGSLSWSEIPAPQNPSAAASGFPTFRIGGKNYKVPDHKDLKAIVSNGDIRYAYGIMYESGAIETALSRATAEGFKSYDNKTSAGTKGVLGVIVYNRSTGAQIFFPVGADGHGRRKANEYTAGFNRRDGNGIQRYGDIDIQLTGESN